MSSSACLLSLSEGQDTTKWACLFWLQMRHDTKCWIHTVQNKKRNQDQNLKKSPTIKHTVRNYCL